MVESGQVIVTEANHHNWFSRGIAYFTGSKATHAFLALNPYTAVEATFPRVRTLRLVPRLQALRADDRAYVVLDIPGLAAFHRDTIATKARSYVERWYDVGQLVLYMMTRQFWNDGAGTLICSRLVTAAYREAGVRLFDEATLRANYDLDSPRVTGLRQGWATPRDLLLSRLQVVDFVPSSRVKKVSDFLTR